MTTDEDGVEVGGGHHPVLERCTSRGLREVVGEEEGERETAREGNGGAAEERHGEEKAHWF